MSVSLDDGALEGLVEWVAAIQEEKDLEPISSFVDLVKYDESGDLPLVAFLQLVDEDAFSSLNAHGDSGTHISHESLSSDIFPALCACLAHAAQVPSVDLQQLGVDVESLTGDSDEDDEHHAIFLACLLYASVHSAKRGDFIARIMALDQATQQQLMGSIQRITTALKDAAASDDEGDDVEASAETATLSQLRSQVRDLTLQNEDLMETNEHLQAKLDAGAGAPGSEQGDSSSGAAAKGGDAEGLLQDLRLTEAELQRSKDAAAAQKEELEAEAQTLRDEVEVLRQRNRDLSAAEADALRLRGQLAEADELKAQLKHSQAEVGEKIKKILDLEEAAKAVPELKKQVEHYKRERVELDAATSAAKVAADTAKGRIASLQEDNAQLEGKVQQLESELASVQAEVAALQESAKGSVDSGGDVGSDIREQIMRLERENASLKEANAGGTAAGGDGGDSALLRSQLEDAQAVRERLEASTAQASTAAEELKVKLQRSEKELAAAKEAANSSGAAAQQLAAAQAQLQQAREALQASEQKCAATELAAETAQAAASASGESSQEAERLQMQLEAASAATEQLGTSNAQLKQKVDKLTLYTTKLSAEHKKALAGEQARVKELQQERSAMQARLEANHRTSDQELNRMSAAMHNLGRELQRYMLQGGAFGSAQPAAVAGGTPGSAGQSFLQQQRSMRSPLAQRVVASSRAQANVHAGYASPLRSAAAAGSRGTPGASR